MLAGNKKIETHLFSVLPLAGREVGRAVIGAEVGLTRISVSLLFQLPRPTRNRSPLIYFLNYILNRFDYTKYPKTPT